MRFPYVGPQPKTSAERQQIRYQTADFMRTRGTAQIPPIPRDVIVQSAPRGLYLTWSLPDPTNAQSSYITGWRIYKGDENTLYEEIKDRGTRQKFIEATAGTTPPRTNVFVSSLNALGKESPRVMAYGTALAETGAPSMPSTPPDYNNGYSGGGSRSSGPGRPNGL